MGSGSQRNGEALPGHRCMKDHSVGGESWAPTKGKEVSSGEME